MAPKVKLVVSSHVKPIRWGPYNMGMANYLKDNYASYKASSGGQKKIAFLRKMRDALKIECTDQQLKNGFSHFIERYTKVKAKLNSSGFGIDPDKDTTLNKGWILKQCPYYDILDEFMGNRPNVNPPQILSTSAINVGIGDEALPTETEPDSNTLQVEDDGNDVESTEEGDKEVVEEESDLNINQANLHTDEFDGASTSSSFVKKALSGINLQKQDLSLKTPLGVFAKVMGDKTAEMVKVEREKLQIQSAQLEADRDFRVESNRIEMLKVNSQIELEEKRLELEEKRIAERKEEREHEIQKMQMQQDFELKKLELQLKLNNS